MVTELLERCLKDFKISTVCRSAGGNLSAPSKGLPKNLSVAFLLPYLNGFKSAAILDKGDNGYFKPAGGIYTENVRVFTFITGKNKKNPIFFSKSI